MNKKINILPEKFFIRANKSVQNLIYCLFLRCYHFWCYCRELREGPFQGGTRILGVYRVAGMCCSKDDPFCLWLWITFSLGKRGICHLSFDTWTGLFFFFSFSRIPDYLRSRIIGKLPRVASSLTRPTGLPYSDLTQAGHFRFVYSLAFLSGTGYLFFWNRSGATDTQQYTD